MIATDVLHFADCDVRNSNSNSNSNSTVKETNAVEHDASVVFDQRLRAHLSELLDDDDDNANTINHNSDFEHVKKRARTASPSTRCDNKPIERMVCDWSGDGLLAFVSAYESRRIYGDRRRIFIAHVNAPEHVGVIETFHEAPIAVLQFAPLSTGRYLLSIDCVSQVGIWVCDGPANRWSLVPALNMRMIEFSYTAIWVRWNAMRTPYAPQCRAARPGVAPQPASTAALPVETPLERKFLNNLRKPDATLSYWIGMPCVLGVSRGRLLAVYERTEDQRWGYVADHSTLPPDAVIGDVAQHADGTIRVVVVAHGNSAALVYLVDLTVRDTAQLSTRLEASIDISFGRWIEHVRFSKLPLVSASIVLVTSSDPIAADGAADAEDVEGSQRWRIERWQVRQRSQSVVVSHVDAAGASTQRDVTIVSSEWYVAAGCLLELGETVTDVLPSSSGLLALAMGNVDEVQLRSADTLERLPASDAVGGGVVDFVGEPVTAIATRNVADFCMTFSPCGTCLAYSAAVGESGDGQPLFGLRIARLTPTIVAAMATREQLARYLADCYEYAIVIGNSSWDVDAVVASVALPLDSSVVPLHELVAHHVLAECCNNTNYATQMRAVLANVTRLHGRGSIECIDWQALLYLKNVIGVIAVVTDNADVQRFHEAYVAQGGAVFTTAQVELAKPNSLITIAPQLNWIVDFVALVLAQAIEFGEQQRRLANGVGGAEPLSRVPAHMLASDAATVASLLVQRAGRKLPLLRIVFDSNLLRSLVKMIFVCGMFGEQWNALVAVQRSAPIASQLALFANLTDVKALLSMLTTLVTVVDSAYNQLPKPDAGQDIVRGVHGAMLANSVGARIDAMLVSESRDTNTLTKHSVLRAYIARRAQMIAQSIGYVMGDASSVTLASPAAMGLLLCATDVVPRNIGVLENDVYGLAEISESMQMLLRVDCLTRQPLRQRAFSVCVQCGRFIFSALQHELHLAWSNCCPVCLSRFAEKSGGSSSATATK